MPTRRRFLTTALSLAASPALVAPAVVFAHDGHDLSRLQAEAVARADMAGLRIDLHLQNGRDKPVRLVAIHTDLGALETRLPLELPAGRALQTPLLLRAEDWPGIFTLILDFGEDGIGSVTVIPT